MNFSQAYMCFQAAFTLSIVDHALMVCNGYQVNLLYFTYNYGHLPLELFYVRVYKWTKWKYWKVEIAWWCLPTNPC